MAIIQFQIPDEDINLKDLANAVAIIMKQLQWSINGNLDVQNIRTEGIDTRNLKAGSVVAEKIDVSELSAISADLGTIVAGIIYGAYIATANGTYPRIELSSVGNLLQAFYDASTYVAINPGIGGILDPIIQFESATTSSSLGNFHAFGDAFILNSDQDVVVQSIANDVRLSAVSGNVSASSSAGTIVDLVASINSLNSSISTLNASVSSLSASKADHGSTSSAAVSDAHNHGFANGTQLLDADGVTVHTWVAYAGSAAHSHTI